MTKQLTLSVPGELTPTAMDLKPGLNYKTWSGLGEKLRYVNTSTRWWLGDWVLYGEKYLAEEYSQALEETDYDKETLRGFVYVAERIPADRRRPEKHVTWSHHRIVAKLEADEADEWLERCAKERWTVKELTREIKRSKREESDEDPPPEDLLRVATFRYPYEVAPGVMYDSFVVAGEVKRHVHVLADLGDQSFPLDDESDLSEEVRRVFVVAVGDEHFDPDRLRPQALAEFVVEALGKELGL